MLKKVRELPPSNGRGGETLLGRDVREFCRNTTYDVAEVAIEGRNAHSLAGSLRRYIKSHPKQCAGIAVSERGGRAYLYRKGVTDR